MLRCSRCCTSGCSLVLRHATRRARGRADATNSAAGSWHARAEKCGPSASRAGARVDCLPTLRSEAPNVNRRIRQLAPFGTHRLRSRVRHRALLAFGLDTLSLAQLAQRFPRQLYWQRQLCRSKTSRRGRPAHEGRNQISADALLPIDDGRVREHARSSCAGGSSLPKLSASIPHSSSLSRV
jgi:hypothetical protein